MKGLKLHRNPVWNLALNKSRVISSCYLPLVGDCSDQPATSVYDKIRNLIFTGQFTFLPYIDILVSLATLHLTGFLVNKCWPVKVSKGNCIYRVTIAKYWQGNCFLSFLCNWRGNLPFFAIIAMKITCYIKNLVSDERKYSFPQLHRRKTF